MRSAFAVLLILVAAAPRSAPAEGTPDQPKPSRKDRIFGAYSVLPVPGGIVPLGGASLRYYDRRTGATRTIRPRERDVMSAVASDPSGRRLLVAWKDDRDLHLYDLARSTHLALPRPNFAGSVASRLAFAADGRAAFVFNTGGGGGVEVYRQPLQPRGEAELLFGGPLGELIWSSPMEVITQCQKYRCPDDRIVRRDLESGAETVLISKDDPRGGLPKGSAVKGSTPGDVLLYLDGRLLRFRARDGAVVNVELPREIVNFVGRQLPPIVFSPARDEAYLITRPGRDLSVWTISVAAEARAEPRRTLVADLHPSDAPAATPPDDDRNRRRPPSVPTVSTPLHALLARSGGGLLIHWGDDVVLLAPDGSPRAVDLRKAAGGSFEWAGVDVLAERPDELWVGVEVGSSRDFLRVPWSKLEALRK